MSTAPLASTFDATKRKWPTTLPRLPFSESRKPAASPLRPPGGASQAWPKRVRLGLSHDFKVPVAKEAAKARAADEDENEDVVITRVTRVDDPVAEIDLSSE